MFKEHDVVNAVTVSNLQPNSMMYERILNGDETNRFSVIFFTAFCVLSSTILFLFVPQSFAWLVKGNEKSSKDYDKAEKRDETKSSERIIEEKEDEIEIIVKEESNDETTKLTPLILTRQMMLQLTKHGLPASCRDKMWVRLFSISRDGDSFSTFLEKVKNMSKTLLAIRTESNVIVGGFVTSTWKKQKGRTFFGSGQSFLYSISSCGKTRVYKWTAANEYFQSLDGNKGGRISIGGGDDSFGLCITDYFNSGSSGSCPTFANPPLHHEVAENKEHPDINSILPTTFKVVEFEVYGFVSPWL